MRVLAIGNSFSEDATYYLHKIAASAGVELEVVNLYIGGCPLETHAYNLANDLAAYGYNHNGCHTDRQAAIKEVLCEVEWDVVTVQQESGRSGLYQSYEPFGSQLLQAIKAYAPKAKVYFHRTWAYDFESTHPSFGIYDNSTSKMHGCIMEASERFAESHKLDIIKSGDVIARLRSTPEFDSENGGISICRDGYHMHLVYGRYAVAATWFETLTGKSIFDADFVPSEKDIAGVGFPEGFECDPRLIAIIKECVHK